MAGIPVRVPRGGRRLGVCLAIGFALAFVAPAAALAARIVAVGDVHGDLEAFRRILAEAGIVDAAGGWIGADAILVQTGDLIDRGPSMRGTLDFVMALERSAAARGGRVVSLLGNHEVMNMAGDLRYVAAANYAEFADAGSEKRRADAWVEVRDLRKRRARQLGQPEPPSGAEEKAAWFQAHPPGFLEHQEAFGPDGVYGRWLRARPACVVVQGTVFLHGGLAPALAGISADEIDRRVHEDLAALDADRKLFVAQGLILPFFDLPETTAAVREALAAPEKSGQRAVYEHFVDWHGWTMNSPEGPLWFRGFAEWSDAEGAPQVARLLSRAGVQRAVVGHTSQKDGHIRVRFGGTLFLIDTGMLDSTFFPGGRASALEIADGVVTAIYPGQPRQVLWRGPPGSGAGQ